MIGRESRFWRETSECVRDLVGKELESDIDGYLRIAIRDPLLREIRMVIVNGYLKENQ